MVIADRNQESSSFGGGGGTSQTSNSSTTTNTTQRRTRTLNNSNHQQQQQQQQNQRNSLQNLNNVQSGGGGNGSCSSDIDDSDSENSVRVGDEYQAEISDTCLPKPASRDLPEKAVMVWNPNNNLNEDSLNDFTKLAKEKYNYSLEQSLGLLFWHDFNLQCALADLPNYAPYPDEWSMEDRALFEQGFQFHNKHFHKINQLLPDKKISSLIKYYYTEKKTKKSNNNSYVDKQVRKANNNNNNSSQNNNNQIQSNNDSNEMMDYENNIMESNNHNSIINQATSRSGVENKNLECSICLTTKTSNNNHFFNTKFGLLCKSCYIKCKNEQQQNQNNLVDDQNDQQDDLFLMQTINDMGKNFRFNSILNDDDSIKQLLQERLTDSSKKVSQSYQFEIENLKEKIRKFKQENELKKTELIDLPDLSNLNQNEKRIVSRWTNEETIMLTYAIRDYGKDFKTIADIIGTKSEIQVKNYFIQNQDKFNYSNLLKELNDEQMDIEDSNNNNNSGGGNGGRENDQEDDNDDDDDDDDDDDENGQLFIAEDSEQQQPTTSSMQQQQQKSKISK